MQPPESQAKQDEHQEIQEEQVGSPIRQISLKEEGDGKKQGQSPQINNDKSSKKKNVKHKRLSTTQMKQAGQTRTFIILESVPYSVTMMIVTIYALFGDDVRMLSTNKETQQVFWVLTIICMVLFSIEVGFNCIAKPDYLFGFYFWLDVISTITMILDIGWITNSWFGSEVGVTISSATTIKKVGQGSKAGRRAGQVIRIIRLVRLVKLYKHANNQLEKDNEKKQLQELIQQFKQREKDERRHSIGSNHQSQPLIQEKQDEESKFVDFAKIESHQNPQSKRKIQLPPLNINADQSEEQLNNQKQFSNQVSPKPLKLSPKQIDVKQEQHSSSREIPVATYQKPEQVQNIEQEIKQLQSESKVGKTLQDRTIKSVIAIIMSIMISIPIFSYETYKDELQSYQTGLDRIFQFKENPSMFSFVFKDYIQYHQEQRAPVIYVYINQVHEKCCEYDSDNSYGFYGENYPKVNDMRFEDINVFTTTDKEGALSGYSVIDISNDNKINAGLSIIRTLFVCTLMAVSGFVFAADVNTLILVPIDRMLKKVDRIAQNPLEAANIEEQEQLLMEELEAGNDFKKMEQKKEEAKMETSILEKLIMKIGALLAVGFGEAGSEIIASNMSRGGEVDPMLPGKKMLAIFGFCDIRNFTDATEVLQTGVMVFVNEIAEIVHGTVDHYSGSANKNIGDAFLLVWKFQPTDFGPDETNPKILKLKSSFQIQQTADLAVLAFLKIITGITISKKLEKYKTNPGLNDRLPNYSVKMGFGLHLGWAIEGAIGSTYKIDASYLSPNVNMASRLEAATKQFGSSILISGVLKKQLSVKCQKHLRHIDTVTVKGSLEPVEMHCVDISYKNLLSAIVSRYDIYDSNSLKKDARKKFSVVNRYNRDKLRENIMKGTTEVADEFETDPELKAARSIFTEEFYEVWRSGFALYLAGNWGEAKKIFEKTLVNHFIGYFDKNFLPDYVDGPSNTLLLVIEESGGKAPSNWEGFRELTEK